MKILLVTLSACLFCPGVFPQTRPDISRKVLGELPKGELPKGFLPKRIMIESDGWQLIGDLRIPRLTARLPVVLMLNKGNGSRAAYIGLAESLARNGIASLRLDLRGHGESTNKGRFVPPFDGPMQQLLIGSSNDVAAAVRYLKNLKEIDPDRVGLVGASYSGEQMALAGRMSGYGKAYVALSPGSFSPESISEIDRSGAAWMFVRSADEKNLKGMHEDIRKTSKSAHLIEVPGSEHATDLLEANPELVEMIAVWLKRHL